MNKKIILGFFTILTCLVLTACSTVTTTRMTLPQSIVFSGSDLVMGDVLTAELPYKSNDPTLKDKLVENALKGTNYDVVIAPKYQIIEKTFAPTVIKMTGRGARIK